MKKKFFKAESAHPLDKKWSRAQFMAIVFATFISIAVLLYIYVVEKNTGGPHMIAVKPSASVDSQARGKIQEKLPQARDQMKIPLPKAIQGKWSVSFGASSIAQITLDEEEFEIIYTEDPKGALRKYSRGAFRYNEETGKLSLYPSREAGEPDAVAGVHYEVLTMRHYDVFLKKKEGVPALYFIAPAYTVPSKSFHPLFLHADYSGAPVLKFNPVK